MLAVPLGITSRTAAVQTLDAARVSDVATEWAEAAGWRLDGVTSTSDGYDVSVAGADPEPDPAELRRRLDADGLAGVKVTVLLVPERVVELEPVD